LKKKITPYIYIVFISLCYPSLYGQNSHSYQLEITSKIKKEHTYLSAIQYRRQFSNEKSLKKTKDSVFSILKERGYYTITQNNLIKKDNHFTYIINLGEKVTSAVLKTHSKDQPLLQSLNINTKHQFATIAIEDLKNTLSRIMNAEVNNGASFSTVNLSNISISKSVLTADLHINRSKKRAVDKITIKGYSTFPKSFLTHYFTIHPNSTVNSKLLEEISRKTNQLDFIEEVKRPEVLFSKDSTILYLYIKKKKSNYFDGLVNFNSENKKIKFRGYFNLSLTNTFNKGEEINIHWKNNGNNKQEFQLSSKIPYLLSTKLSTSFSFNIYKHDSTYINTNSRLAVEYPINKNLLLHLITLQESSQTNINQANLDKFKKFGIGLGLTYKTPKKENLELGIELLRQTRRTATNKTSYQLNLHSLSTVTLSKKLSFFIKNTTTITSFETNLDNELFRLGGMTSIRGFQENSILSNSYSFINSEFRLHLKNNTSIFSIHDIGLFRLNKHNNTLSAIGLGYRFKKRNNNFSLEYIIGNPTRNNATNSSMISIKMLTIF